MMHLVSKTTAEGFLVNYVNLLNKVGYVKPSKVKKLLLYTFIVDFIEYMHAYIDEKDYKVLERLLGKIYVNGNCLLPYPVFCVRRATLGSADYMGDFHRRVTEVEADGRITESEEIRTA